MSQNKKIGYVFLTLIITLVITISYMHLWGTNIKVPLTGYRSDSIGVLLEANNYVRGGDVHRNVCYGAPNVNSYTYSIGDSSVPMPLIKILAHLTGSVEAAINIHAIMNSVLLACSMCWICIRLKIHEIISMIAGISYSCLSFFVLWCNTLLLIYGFCFYIPLFCYIVINLMSTPSEEMQKGKNKIFSIIFIIGVMFFSMTMAITLGLIVSKLKSTPGLAFGFTTIGLFLGFVPTFFFKLSYGIINNFIISFLTLVCWLILLKILRKESKNNG